MTSTSATHSPAPAVGGVQTVRRVITYILLIIMVTIAALGLTHLLNRLLSSGTNTTYYDNYGLALALASALIAGPLAAVLWWLTWRTTANERDRASIAWPVYLVLMSTSALLVFTIALFRWIGSLLSGHSERYTLAVAIVWGAVWLWHFWMWRHPAKGPIRLAGVAPALASLIGLTFGAGGLIFAIARLIDTSVGVNANVIVGEDVLWQLIAQSLVWAVGGGVLWAWHWFGMGVRNQTTGFSHVVLAYIAGGASLALIAYGASRTISVVLQLLVNSSTRPQATLQPLGIAVACAAVGALVFVYHWRVVATQPAEVRAATRLVSAGVSLAFFATGVGMVVDAALAATGDVIVDSSPNTLMLSGLSTLLVGGALWWVTWKPWSALSPARIATSGRSAYLVVIFGASALVALITLLVIGFQFFTLMLDGSSGGGFLAQSRHAIGLLVATLLVAAYHFAIWRTDRAADTTEDVARRISRVTLVVSAENGELIDAVRASTGARVSVLQRTDVATGETDVSALVTALESALDGVEAAHVLVVVGAQSTIEVIQLAD